MMYDITIKLKFEAAHRLLTYQGKCKHLHGHSYLALVNIGMEELQPDGFVMDFGVLKKIVGDWIDTHWDHVTILHKDDPLLFILREHACKVYELPENPTAEHMAQHLYAYTCAVFSHRTKLLINWVTIQETETSWATYRPKTYKGECLDQ